MSADVVALRRELHAHPELGFLELRTAARVIELLEAQGYAVAAGRDVMAAGARMGLPPEPERERARRDADLPPELLARLDDGFTAVVATLDGDEPGPVVGIRVDMDALPVLEDDAAEHAPAAGGFRSAREGVMHACGHDGHTAIGLALGARLADRRFPGRLKLVFQPAEEGLRGARSVAESGAVDDVDALLCLHLGLGVPTGTVYAATGGGLASAKLLARFRGQGAHAGIEPERGRSALLAAAAAALAAHTLAQHGGVPTRVNVGRLNGGTAANVVAEEAELLLEVRAGDEAACDELTRRVVAALQGSADAYGVTCEVETVGGAGPVSCDEPLARRVAELAAGAPGVRHVEPRFDDGGSEDASWLLARVRAHGGSGTYMVIGSDSPAGHHDRRFDLDEAALPVAVDLLERLVRNARELVDA